MQPRHPSRAWTPRDRAGRCSRPPPALAPGLLVQAARSLTTLPEERLWTTRPEARLRMLPPVSRQAGEHRDDIEVNLGRPGSRRSEPFLSSAVHGLGRPPEGGRRSGLHLAEHHQVAATDDQVEFTRGTPPAARQHAVAVPAVAALGHPFAVGLRVRWGAMSRYLELWSSARTAMAATLGDGCDNGPYSGPGCSGIRSPASP